MKKGRLIKPILGGLLLFVAGMGRVWVLDVSLSHNPGDLAASTPSMAPEPVSLGLSSNAPQVNIPKRVSAPFHTGDEGAASSPVPSPIEASAPVVDSRDTPQAKDPGITNIPAPSRRSDRKGHTAPPRDLPPILARPPRGMTPEQRLELSAIFRQQAEVDLAHARAIAHAQGWSERGIAGEREYRLVAIRDGKVYMDVSDNEDAGISTAANQVQASPFLFTGSNVVIGLWETGGVILSNHQEYAGRFTLMDTDTTSSHATHVAGTMVAAGVSNEAVGMAPGAIVHSWNTTFSSAEIILVAMADPDETNAIQLSNHSYGTLSGWANSYTPSRWYGKWPATESDNFGLYETQTWEWDVGAYAAPYHLAFKSAGNDRNDSAPANGEDFQYYSGSWTTSVYDSAVHPLEDGWDNGGYDTITPKGNAKNIMTVGAVKDAVSGGVRALSGATMTTFSGWGPTDDGRIKPDIVGNGNSLYSSDSDHTQDYSRKTGTSMSAPNVCGSTALLLDLYLCLFPVAPLSSTLKGLVLHTADDLGNTGPDYTFGWGLMNTRNAAEHLLAQFHNPNSARVTEGEITLTRTNISHSFTWQSNGVIQATLCWNDPPGPIQTGVDSTNLILVNDLDLKLFAPDGTEYLPWILDPASPSTPASTGVNFRDNVEQVQILSPATAGIWTAQVSIATTISNDVQTYSLFITGHDDTVDRSPRFLSHQSDASSIQFEWNSLTGKIYHVHRATNLLGLNPFSNTIAVVTGEFISTSFTDTNIPAAPPFFYQLEEE